MNKIFDFNRFVKYFKYDLVNAKNNFGLTALILGLSPVIIYLIVNIFALVLTGSFTEGHLAIPIVAWSITAVAVTLFAGPRLYGDLTKKKAGSNWLLIPASTLEKTLSMILISCVAVPIAVGILLVGSDLFMSLLPGYGHSVTGAISEFSKGLAESGTKINWLGIGWSAWAEYILIFTLGAILFKKSKVVKTFLSALGINSLLGVVFGKLFSTNTDWLEELVKSIVDGGAVKIQSTANIMLNVSCILFFAILGVLIYWRISKLKH